MERKDPYTSFNFRVEIDGIIVVGFSEVSGLQIETEVEEYREGGVNDFVHKFPKITKFSNLILKHGLTDFLLWAWYGDIIQGKIERKNGIIFLLDSNKQPAMWWEFSGAFPVKWTGPELKADSSTVAFETLEIVYQSLKPSK